MLFWEISLTYIRSVCLQESDIITGNNSQTVEQLVRGFNMDLLLQYIDMASTLYYTEKISNLIQELQNLLHSWRNYYTNDRGTKVIYVD